MIADHLLVGAFSTAQIAGLLGRRHPVSKRFLAADEGNDQEWSRAEIAGVILGLACEVAREERKPFWIAAIKLGCVAEVKAIFAEIMAAPDWAAHGLPAVGRKLLEG